MGRRRVVRSIFWVVVVGAICLAAGSAQNPQNQPPAQPPSTQEPTKPIPPPDQAQSPDQQERPEVKITPRQAEELFHSVDEILEFDSKQTGLPVKHNVKRKLTSRDEVVAYLTKHMNDEDTRRLRRSELVLKKFGLLPRNFDLQTFLVALLKEEVAGYYDPKTKTVNLLDWVPIEEQEPVMAHELTHALQDQAMHLDRQMKALKDDGDRGLALQCLLEGEATVVMVRAVAKDLPGDSTELEDSLEPLLSAGALERANVPKDLPDYFVDELFFPYVDGTAYVRRALKKGGWKAVDELWKSPPRSTSEILHDGARFVPVENLLPGGGSSLGPAGSRFLYSDTLGEWTVRFLLRRGLPEAEADGAAAGWRGDRLAFYASGSGISYLWRARLESPAAAQRLEAAWKKARARDELIARQGADLVVALGFEKLPDLP